MCIFNTKHVINRGKRLHTLCASALLTFSLGLFWTSPAIGAVAQNPLLVTSPVRPNILLIPDTAESMQEGIDGRLALDWEHCSPGPSMDADACPAGARNPDSKASIIKRVSQTLVDSFQGNANLGMMSYQQNPASTHRNDFNSGGTVRWRLLQRAVDVRYATTPEPDWYDPEFDGAWDSPTKRYRDPHPTNSNIWIFYNVGVPGYFWDDPSPGVPTTDRTQFAHFTGETLEDDPDDGFENWRFLHLGESGEWQFSPSGLWYDDFDGTFNTFLVDSLRQRGIDSWGLQMVQQQVNQLEWRTTTSPGLGYLHIPIGGLNEDGVIDSDHWDALRAKLEPQRHDWNPTITDNPMTDPDWPLIAAGLTPLEGTILTARDYFIGENDHFGEDQGSDNSAPLPESCGSDSIIWLTDGLPSVDPDGNPLGDDPAGAVLRARDAIQNLYDTTEDRMDNPVQTHIVGFALPPGLDNVLSGPDFDAYDNPLDILAVAGGTSRIRDAADESELEDVMADLLAQIVRDAQSSSAAVATNSTRLDTETLIYQGRYDTRDWSGQLLAFELDEDSGEVADEPLWDAGDFIPSPNQRNIVTWNPETGNGARFIWDDDELTEDQMAALNRDSLNVDDGRGEDRLWWLRGDDTYEGSDFRARNTVLGSIVNSDPVVVGTPDFDFDALPGQEGENYFDFRALHADRREMLYFGANAGMLHAIDAETGEEVFAFVPNEVYPNLSELTDPEYTHRFYVDGSPRVSDAWFDSEERWGTVLVGATGAGGGSIFALDITEPDSFGADNVMWEFSHEDIGYSVSQPTVARLPNETWVVIFGDGYGGESGESHLFVVDLESGALLAQLEASTDSAEENGMATPVPLGIANRRITDTVYAGDMLGNLWRFDLSGNNANQWGSEFTSANTPQPLFQARGPDGEVQPITTRPRVGLHPEGGLMLYFGTGSLFLLDDINVPVNPNDREVQSFYGIRDFAEGNRITDAREAELQQQVIIDEVDQDAVEGDAAGTFNLRVTSQHAVDYSNQRGWFLDLISPVNGRESERVISSAVLRGDRIIFTTLIPSGEACGFGGTGWLMEMDALSGGRLHFSPFDLVGDGTFDESNWVEVEIDGEMEWVPVSGIQGESGIGAPTGTPAVISAGTREYKYTSTSSGDIDVTVERGDDSRGRQSWKQLR